MKIHDVIKELQIRLPLVTNLFNEYFVIDNGYVGLTLPPYDVPFDTAIYDKMTFHTTEPHGLEIGDDVAVNGVLNGLPILSVSVDNGLATLNFNLDHGYNFDRFYTQQVTISGSDDSDGSYNLFSVPDKNTLVIEFDGTDITGTAFIAKDEGFDGFYSVVDVPDAQTFVVDVRTDIFTQPYIALSEGTAILRIRIAGVADMDRFNAVYTAQEDNRCWLVVVPPSNRSSRDRNVPTDAISGVTQAAAGVSQVEIRQAQLETLEIYAVIPASMEVSGRIAADIAEEVRWALYQALVAASVPTLAKEADVYAIMPVSDTYFAYLTDNTTYTHQYTFERVVYMSQLDVAQPRDQTAPFRGLSLEVLPCDSQSS